MSKRHTIAAVICLVMGLGFGSPAHAADLVYASGPGNGIPPGSNYPVPVLVVQPGDHVTFVNIDIALHDVRSTSLGTDRPWCSQFPFGFGPGNCPLFTSKLIGAAGTSPIFGIEDATVPEGELYATYPFVCSIHAWMEGTLVVVELPTLT